MSLICVQFSGYNARQKYVEVSKGFSIPVGNFVIFERSYDIDSDGKPDKIFVYGEKQNNETEYAERMNLAVVYGKNGFVKKTNVSHIKGYVCDLEVQDFTGDKHKDLMLKTFADENKSVMSVFVADFGQEIPQSIMGDFRGISPSFSFGEGFVVNCSLINGQNFSVNLENKKELLTESGIFDESGKCTKEEKIYAKPFCDIKPVDFDSDMQFEIEGTQKVVFGNKETELFSINSVQKYSGKKWDLVKIEVKY